MVEEDVAESALFRQEALQALEETDAAAGELLDISPRWTRWAYWLLAAAVCGSLSFAAFAFVGEYATGAAVVRVEGRTDLTATASGTVDQVLVQPGQHVVVGQPLVRFNVASESAELERLQMEFDGELVKVLRDPNDQVSRQGLTSLRAQKELAATRVAQRSLHAPLAGIVSDLRIRRGQLLQAGDLVLSLNGAGTRFVVVALLPGQFRPMLHRGMPLRLRLQGFARASELTTIDSVGDEVVGPAEARRYLGPDVADALPINGPVVLVKATLEGSGFVSDGKRFNFYDGLTGSAEARFRWQRVLAVLVPGLRWVLADGN
jgi:membrane fusion protein (multidrug efflux system)